MSFMFVTALKRLVFNFDLGFLLKVAGYSFYSFGSLENRKGGKGCFCDS